MIEPRHFVAAGLVFAARRSAAAPIYLSAAWLGMKFFGGSTDKLYYRVALAVLMLIAVAALVA